MTGVSTYHFDHFELRNTWLASKREEKTKTLEQIKRLCMVQFGDWNEFR